LIILFVGLMTAFGQQVVPKISLADGNQIPILGLGTWKSDTGLVYQAVLDAIEAGYRHIDTSLGYNTEPEIGSAIKKLIADGKIKREDVFITTKLENNDHPRSKVIPALNKSLTNLQMKYVDLYLVHFPGSNSDSSLVDTWHGMEDAHEQGLAKSIGVSNYNIKQMDTTLAAAKVKPATHQVLSNPYHHQSQLLTYLKGKNIPMTAYSPLGGQDIAGEVSKLIAEPKLQAIAKAHNVTVPQVMIRFQIQRNVVVIPKSTTKKYILENISVFDFKLTDDEIKSVESLTTDNGAFVDAFTAH